MLSSVGCPVRAGVKETRRHRQLRYTASCNHGYVFHSYGPPGGRLSYLGLRSASSHPGMGLFDPAVSLTCTRPLWTGCGVAAGGRACSSGEHTRGCSTPHDSSRRISRTCPCLGLFAALFFVLGLGFLLVFLGVS